MWEVAVGHGEVLLLLRAAFAPHFFEPPNASAAAAAPEAPAVHLLLGRGRDPLVREVEGGESGEQVVVPPLPLLGVESAEGNREFGAAAAASLRLWCCKFPF